MQIAGCEEFVAKVGKISKKKKGCGEHNLHSYAQGEFKSMDESPFKIIVIMVRREASMRPSD